MKLTHSRVPFRSGLNAPLTNGRQVATSIKLPKASVRALGVSNTKLRAIARATVKR